MCVLLFLCISVCQPLLSQSGDAWLQASSNVPDAPPPASERESKAGLPTAASSGEESGSDAEKDTDQTRTWAGQKIVPPSRLGY